MDIVFTQEIIDDLSTYLDVPTNRIQVVSVEEAQWRQENLGCDALRVSDNVEGEITPEVTEDILQTVEATEEITPTVTPTVADIQTVDGFRYVLLVGINLYEYHTEGLQDYQRCEQVTTISGEILIAVDPLASETFRVVQNLLATDLDLSTRSVQLIEMLPVTWTDTSLGCPQADQTYTDAEIPGYYVVVSVGEEQYIYHSDSITVYPCSADQSTLPENQ